MPDYTDYLSLDPESMDPESKENYDLMMAEKEYYERELLRQEMRQVPLERECHRYRWKQTDDLITVEIPIPKLCLPKDVSLILSETQFMVSIKNDPDFGEVSGDMMGNVYPEKSSWSLEEAEDGSFMLRLIAHKGTTDSTYQMWFGFLDDEQPAPTIRFHRNTKKYAWKQSVHAMEVEIPVPAETKKKDVHLEIGPTGKTFKLYIDTFPSFGVLEDEFFGIVSEVDSMWLLDGEDEERKICAFFKKKRQNDNEPEWWSSLVKKEYLFT